MQHVLIGKTVTAIHLAADKQAIKFDIEGGEPIVAHCDADCCSYTWIEHVELPALGFPFHVTAKADLDLPGEKWDEAECSLVQFYGLKLVTDKGDFVLDFRNESNGYYGGSLCWPGGHHYGGVHGQNVSDELWQKLESDV